MLNFFLKYSVMQLALFSVFIFFLKKASLLKNTYDFFIILIFNLVSSSLILVFFNAENYFAFVFLTEIVSVFTICIFLAKENFTFRLVSSNIFLLTPFFFFKPLTFSNFGVFNFFLNANKTNDFFKVFYYLNTAHYQTDLFFALLLINFILIFFLNKNNGRLFFLRKNSFLKTDKSVFIVKTFKKCLTKSFRNLEFII